MATKPTPITLSGGGRAFVAMPAKDVRRLVERARSKGWPKANLNGHMLAVDRILAVDGQELPNLDEQQAA